jgi:sialate O-acetylesterase
MLQRIAASLGCALAAAALVALSALAAPARAQAPLMDALFSDHVVLQRDRPIPIWGRAAANEQVTITLSGSTRSVRADANGRWSLRMPELPAGGPHTLTARTANRLQNAHDVLVGDVWLCAGQSNMEWPVRASLDSRAEIAASADGIRQVKIPRASSLVARASFDAPLEWKVASPDTTGEFSATCYFFARELRKTVDVPVGLVVSAWGGSKIEPWMSARALRALGGNDAALDIGEEFRRHESAAAARWGEHWKQWWRAQDETQGLQPWNRARGDAAQWRPAPGELTPWENWDVPELARFDGMVWYRTQVKLGIAQARQSATLSLGQVDEVDLVFVNGRAVGSGPCCGERSYSLPPGILKAGSNLIVVNALDTYASGGMYGPRDKRFLHLADGTKIPLVSWEYQIAPADLSPPRAPWEPTGGMAMLYNAMIAPLGSYGFRGVVWYQGESNTTVPEGRRYQAQLQGLMADWRRQFDAPLPFLVVQLANYGPMAKVPVESGAALTRDAQRRAVAADGNAGLAVTLDIGNRDDVHPTNKQEVGRRLARAARRVVFGEKISASGAQPLSAVRSGSEVQVTFGDVDGSLVVYNSRDPSAFELCGAAPGSCRYVRAQLGRDASVLLDAREVEAATRVRFCWADSPLCNLYVTDGLPVGPFEIEIK